MDVEDNLEIKMKKYEEEYEEFWKPIIEYPDGSINKTQLMRELSDYSKVIEYCSKVYWELTGGTISKPLTYPEVVISKVQEIQ